MILGNSGSVEVDGYIKIPVVMVSAAFVSYDQRATLISYLLITTYAFARTYTWIDDNFRYVRFNTYVVVTLGIVYTFARFSQKLDREKFEQNKNQKLLLQLFHNLIKVYHDGIVITQEKDIVYNNKAISNIFNINNSQINHQEPELKLFSRSSIPEQELDSQEQNFSDLWDYIQKSQQFLDPRRFNRDFLINPLDGMYFKLKQQYFQNDASQSQDNIHDKVLQVFTQSLRLGNKVYVISTIRDQSSWLEIEKQKNLSQLKTIAFASAAHEFRNPLNAINSSLQLIDSQIKDLKTKQLLQTAINCSKLMLFLVNDLLDFSQLEQKKLVLSFENVNIRKLSAECFSILQLKAQVKELEFKYEFSDDFPDQIYTDKNRLAQILINLLSNALKYTLEGHVKIVGSVDQLNKQVILVIDDSGVGMSENQIKQLFTTFTKIMDNRSLNKEGVGLGLTISKNLAKALGGDITVISEVDSSRSKAKLIIKKFIFQKKFRLLKEKQSQISQ
eukprot:403352075